MNPDRVTQILRFALAKARREDFGYGDLGMIHLIKLLYLADHDYAQAHGGETFTGIRWVFYHFGPWNEDAWKHAGTVLDDPEVEARSFLGSGFERRTYRLRSKGMADEIFIQTERLLPMPVTRAVGAAVHEFGADTRRLLHHVYGTTPMRATAPGDPIDFDTVISEEAVRRVEPLTEPSPLSKTQQRKADETKARLRESIAAKAAAKQRARVVPPPLNGRELAALEEITRVLTEDEDQAPTDIHGELVFSPELWRSDFRREHGLS